ncbi:tripartite-type tricarboxylate transporter receptor subunit TctC [Humitalea rosea]|uniref:Tripartite-type tricarboxylate transporter receptor subunit TctC n=1 Tax=Humitalea rosea TaxID=990373 RepID=A0A2W7HUP9_9PROT|nr:tripartite tricarboxylate transporter substrate-binding protein [Humitalea rosea]PZW37730.1 tripartite-type tricarboxylate transporter receptor subunit TctC [Humitalea rosea]
MPTTRRTLLGAALLPLVARGAAAQSWPNRPITIVVPFAAGSSTDVVGRQAARAMSEALEQQVVVENRTGASGIIGAQAVAHARPDGYTLLIVTNSTHAANKTLFRNLPYDPVADFVPISNLATGPLILLSHPALPIRSAQELVAYGRANPGKLSYGYSGSSSQIAAVMVTNGGQFDAVGVQYRSIPPAVTDLLGGQISFTFADPSNALQHIRSGRAIGLGVTSAQRTPLAPDVPTLTEAGLPGFDLVPWQGIAAPAGTDPAIIHRIFDALRARYDTPQVRQSYAALGFEVNLSASPEAYGDFIRSETTRWGDLVRLAGIEPQ